MSLYKRPDSDTWWVNISVPGHPRIRRSTERTDRTEAQRVHDEIKASLWSAPKLTGRTWGDAVLRWCSMDGRGEPDILRMRKFSRVYADRPIHKVDEPSLREALSRIAKTPGTYNRYRNCVSAILNGAVDEGWIATAPKLAGKKNRTKPREWITHEQWDALHAELPPHMKPMAEFAIETGLRQANVLGLTWARIDLNRGVCWVEAEDTKAGKALAVPLSARAIEVLAACRGINPEFVFTYRGKPIKEIKTAFQAACIRTELGRVGKDGRYTGFTWHGFRHTWATWHVQNGTPLDVLQKLGGWSDLRMVLNYAQHSPGYLAQFANNARKKTCD